MTGQVLSHWQLGTQGQQQSCVETVTNQGTQTLADLPMQHLLMNVETLTIIDSYDTTLALASSRSQHFEFSVATQSLSPATYACVLQVHLTEDQWQILDFATFNLTDTVGSECSTVYGIHDEEVNDSQLFTHNLNDKAIHPLGPLYLNYDLEGLDIHPQTHQLYATSGQKASRLYQVNGHNGDLTPIGNIGFTEVESLAFKKEGGSLWVGPKRA